MCGADIVPETGTIDGDSWGWGEGEKTPVGCDGIVCDPNGESPRGCGAGIAGGPNGPALKGNVLAPVVRVDAGEVGREAGVSKPVPVTAIC